MRYGANETIALMRQLAETTFPGNVVDIPEPLITFHGPDASMGGFGAYVDKNLTLVYLDPADIPDWEWSVQVSSGLAVGVPAGPELMSWINDHNRMAVIGKYYSVPGSEADLVSVVHETMLWGGYFKAIFDNQSSDVIKATLGHRLLTEMRHITEAGPRGRNEIVSSFGGKPFDFTQGGLINLFFVSAGDSVSPDK